MAPLPKWATEAGENVHGLRRIVVDTDHMYPQVLGELRDYYRNPANYPAEWKKADGELKKEWRDALDALHAEVPDAYWLEVAYQIAKLDLQVAVGMEPTENRFVDPHKQWAQAFMWLDEPWVRSGPRPEGRGLDLAAKGKEAREHYRRLRGFIPG